MKYQPNRRERLDQIQRKTERYDRDERTLRRQIRPGTRNPLREEVVR